MNSIINLHESILFQKIPKSPNKLLIKIILKANIKLKEGNELYTD